MSVEPRLYLDQPLEAGARLTLDREAAHYLVNVMRRQAGDGVRVFNARDGEWQASLVEANRRAAVLGIGARLRAPEACPDITLHFAPVKRARTDFIVEKATELGAARIVPVMTRRTHAERVRLDRLAATAREAAEQTERLDIPEIGEPVGLTNLLEAWDPARRLIFCDEGGDARPILEALEAVRSSAPEGAWAILIGPEGGFDAAERSLLRSLSFVVPVTLGPRILRADTAAAAALTVWQAVLGDWR